MTNKNFLMATDILRKYIDMDEMHGYSLAVGHDQLWFVEYDRVTSKEDIEKLEELDWFEDEDSWSCFV